MNATDNRDAQDVRIYKSITAPHNVIWKVENPLPTYSILEINPTFN